VDNCEHLLDAAAELVGAIVAECNAVTIVATSREPLGVAGEKVMPVASLEALDAVELFCDRASLADVSFEVPTQAGRRWLNSACGWMASHWPSSWRQLDHGR
jgi:predicted ATPase